MQAQVFDLRSQASVLVPTTDCALQELCSHAAQNREHSRTFIRVLAALVAEFNPESANCCGLTYTQHEQCRTSFEEACLRQIYEAGMLVAMTASLDHEAPTVTGRCPCDSSSCDFYAVQIPVVATGTVAPTVSLYFRMQESLL